jgi:hypothetical protein
MSIMTDEEAIQMEEAKLVAGPEADAVVAQERRAGNNNEEMLKELWDTTYEEVLAQELGVE